MASARTAARIQTGSVKKPKSNKLQRLYQQYVNFEFAKSLVFDVNRLPIVSVFVLLVELVLNVLVVQRVPYTEIDWKAYMQECEGFLNGTTDYSLLKGDTGPLVYPAGFVYIYSALYYITSRGENVRLAQYIFVGIYLLQLYLVLRLYTKSKKVPPYVLVISVFTSYRIHSIYVLRLFNDPIAVLFLYAALNLFMDKRWSLGSLFFSLGVSVKMNILLFAPALLLFYITNLGYLKTAAQLFICGIVQLIVGAPFLVTFPFAYLKGSFDLGRVFEHKWTVNYRFLERELFENKLFHIGLLAFHLILLVVFAAPTFRFFQSYCRLRELQKQLQPQIERENIEKKKKKPKQQKPQEEQLTSDQEQFLDSFEKSLQKSSGAAKPEPEPQPQAPSNYSIDFDRSTQLALLPLFLCNLIGLACARSLHYQFYVWYFHSLPYLTWSTDYSLGMRFLILGLIEFSWNTYPSTVASSLILHFCHLVLIFGVGRKFFKTNQDGARIKIQ